jgi:hypothetical protein
MEVIFGTIYTWSLYTSLEEHISTIHLVRNFNYTEFFVYNAQNLYKRVNILLKYTVANTKRYRIRINSIQNLQLDK